MPGGEERGDTEGDMEKDATEPREIMNSGNNKVTGNNESVDEGELPPWLAKFKKKKSVREDEQIDPSKSGDEYTDINKDMKDAADVTNSGTNNVTEDAYSKWVTGGKVGPRPKQFARGGIEVGRGGNMDEDEEIIIKGAGEKKEKSERHDDDDEGEEKEKNQILLQRRIWKSL